jgi:hypothetical protein
MVMLAVLGFHPGTATRSQAAAAESAAASEAH